MPPRAVAPVSSDAIKVAVRVRPFNQREMDNNSKSTAVAAAAAATMGVPLSNGSC